MKGMVSVAAFSVVLTLFASYRVEADAISDLLTAMSEIDQKPLRGTVINGSMYEIKWSANSSSFSLIVDGQNITDVSTINDTAPISFSGIHSSGNLPEVSGSAKLATSALLVVTMRIRPSGTTWYDATFQVSLDNPISQDPLVIETSDWLATICRCQGASDQCIDMECDLGRACGGGGAGRCRFIREAIKSI